MPEDTLPAKRPSLVGPAGAESTMCFVTVGQILGGRYRLEREVARGGMGIVFAARDEELDGRPVAIKVLPPEMAHDANAVKRFKREAIAAIDLTHPNVVRLHSFEQSDGQAFLVMELLEGGSLEDRLADEGPLPLDDVVAVARQAAAGLDGAHRTGVVHRDVKPANILYKDRERTTAKVADFGIAQQIKDSMTRLTGQASAGTLLYVAPEQLQGKVATAKVDQYSLAATVYELVAGRPVFSGAGLSVQILEALPQPIKGVPAQVNAALERALAKDPDERFSSCSAFVEALEGAVEQKVGPAPVQSCPTTKPPIGPVRPSILWPCLAVLVLSALAAPLLIPFFDGGRSSCLERLRNVGQAIMTFQSDQGRHPTSLNELSWEGYIADPSFIRCPRTGKPYRYVLGDVLQLPGAATTLSYDDIVAVDDEPGHDGSFCVLTIDGSVRVLTFDEVTRRVNELSRRLYQSGRSSAPGKGKG